MSKALLLLPALLSAFAAQLFKYFIPLKQHMGLFFKLGGGERGQRRKIVEKVCSQVTQKQVYAYRHTQLLFSLILLVVHLTASIHFRESAEFFRGSATSKNC